MKWEFVCHCHCCGVGTGHVDGHFLLRYEKIVEDFWVFRNTVVLERL